MSTGGAIKRVSRQKKLSTPDTPSVVGLNAADRFDGGQTGGGGSSFVYCLLLTTGFVNSLLEIPYVTVWRRHF